MCATEFPERFSLTVNVQAPDQMPCSSLFFLGMSVTSPYRPSHVIISKQESDSLRVKTVTFLTSFWRDTTWTAKSRQPGSLFISS
ncbi:hypothetical protein GDO78_020350 [Eleutherodactylus coqui]|uniref:Uncharacterized protein n=1 Tax=Eleutherodactylus coqui TaxID=57060 RepID=A0A8J6E2Y1_ELECQ|nr:hypothetical protein GDO78_020350 [Eleutherodactylus coqui]